MDTTDYEDSDHEDGDLSDLPIFFAINEFSSVCERVDENIDISIVEKDEKAPMEDVEMNENHNIDHSDSKETLQWSLAKDPFLVVMELSDQSRYHYKEMEFEVASTRNYVVKMLLSAVIMA
nr:hypothetical protein [Tanacetum cinerariifolium]